MAVKRTMYQCKVDVDMLNAVKSMLADVSSVSPSGGYSRIGIVEISQTIGDFRVAFRLCF